MLKSEEQRNRHRDYAKQHLHEAMEQLAKAEEGADRHALRNVAADYATIFLALDR